jgi:hypothetical protein
VVNTSDFTLRPDGAGGTDVIVSTVFGTYTTGVTLLTNPTTVAANAYVGSTASLIPGLGGPAGTAWTVTNLGTINSATGPGATLQSGGDITNDGTMIAGSGAGVIAGYNSRLTVSNNGVLLGDGTPGILLNAGGFLSNSSTGTISSTSDAVAFAAGIGTLENSGSITASSAVAVYLASGTVVNTGLISASVNYGAIVIGSGAVTNVSTGTIRGVDGVYVLPGSNATVTNSGTIIGLGIYAVNFGGTGTRRLIDNPGAVFTNGIYGGASGATAVMELASAASAGIISGFGTDVTNFTSLVFDPGARWTVAGVDSANGLGTLGIAGFTIGDTIDLSNFTAVSDNFTGNVLTLTDATNITEILNIQGTFGATAFGFAPDDNGGTNVFLAPPDLLYGQTIDEAGIVATSETVTAGTLTLFNGVNAVGTIAVGTTLNTSDFTLAPDSASGTDVIVSTVFGTYGIAVILQPQTTTIAASARIAKAGEFSVYGLGNAGQSWTAPTAACRWEPTTAASPPARSSTGLVA